MNKFIRFYNRNRKMFWLIVIIAIMVISIPKALNQYQIELNKAKEENDVSSSISDNTTTYGNSTYQIISGKTTDKQTANENVELIEKFINYCNKNSYEEAYNLLSENCKQKLYLSLEDFKNKYINNIFSTKKTFSITGWNSGSNYFTYKINLKEDALSTGVVTDSFIEDYYTVILENGEYKLNINNYIKTKELNVSNSNEQISITVLSKDIYVDYEVYNFNVENKTAKCILLDSLESTDTMYLVDDSNLIYKAYSHEIPLSNMRVIRNDSISIKYNKKSGNDSKIEKIVFKDIVLDYDSYIKLQNKKEFTNRAILEIEL